MALTEVDICNRALVILGAEEITALTDDNDRARACNRVYEAARDAVMEMHNWTSLIQRAKIGFYTGLIGETGQTGSFMEPGFAGLPQGVGFENSYDPYDYVYSLPETPAVVRVIEKSDEENYPYLVEKDLLFTDDPGDVYIRYLAKITDPTLWDFPLVDTLVHRMAYMLAVPVAGSKALREDMKKEYLECLIRYGVVTGRAGGGAAILKTDGAILGSR